MGIFDKVKARSRGKKEREFVHLFLKRLSYDKNIMRFIMTNPGRVLNQYNLSDKAFNAIVLFTHILNSSKKKRAREKDASDYDVPIIPEHLKGVESLGLDIIKKETLSYLENFKITEMYDTSKIIPRLAYSKFYDFISEWYMSCGGYTDATCSKCGHKIYATSSDRIPAIPPEELEKFKEIYPEFAFHCQDCGKYICINCIMKWHEYSDKKYVSEPMYVPLCPQCSSILKG